MTAQAMGGDREICLAAGIVDNLAKATAALGRDDYEMLGRAAHTLKGTLLQCGLNELAGLVGSNRQL